MIEHDFERLRNEWALKAVISKETVDYECEADRLANPHNEPYHNKRPRRERAAIVSDCSYIFADGVLVRQYGRTYVDWRDVNFQADPFIHGLYRTIRRRYRD
jgi:hypothetical protein